MFKFLNLVFLVVFATKIDSAPNKGTLFELNADRVEQMEVNLKCTDWSNLKIRKISRSNTTRAVFGEVYFYIPFSDEIELEVKLYKKQGNEYRLQPYRVPKSPICTFLGSDTYAYPDIAKQINFPLDIDKKCPLPPQNITINGLIPDYSTVPKVVFPSGDYAADTIYHYHNEVILRMRAYGTVHNVGN